MSKYIQNHKEQTRLLYHELNQKLQDQKSKVCSKIDKNIGSFEIKPEQEI